MHYELKGKKPGETQVTISVLRQNDKIEIAKTSFPVKVTSYGSTTVIEDSELQRIKSDLEKVTKELEVQKEEIKETQGTLEKIVSFFKKFFGRIFKL